jgi:hypothetical protein
MSCTINQQDENIVNYLKFRLNFIYFGKKIYFEMMVMGGLQTY